MTASLILWGHALAALLFVAAALRLRDAEAAAALPRPVLAVALGVTALWALAVAGIDARDPVVRLLVGFRDVAWLAAMLAMVRRGNRGGATVALHVTAMAVLLLAAAVAVAASGAGADAGLSKALVETRLLLRALGLLAALILATRPVDPLADTAPARRLVAVALVAMWGVDLVMIAAGGAIGGWPAGLAAARGGVMAVVALLIAAAVGHRDRPLAVSRAAVARLVAIVALAAYAGAVALVAAVADSVGGAQARLVQTAIVFGATAALLTLVSTPWLRGWAKVMVAKHLFGHRYDYRAEWQRFGDTLAGTGPRPATLGERVARAVADLTVSPAALLLSATGNALAVSAEAGWSDALELGPTAALAAHLRETGRIVELDAVRRGTAPEVERAAVPAALLDRAEAWAIVPLAHRGGLVGAAVLARPPVDRALDWEDFDLLRVAGRQAAGVLAEDAARRALADGERFEEFNRRFAFILHDIKNLVSQLALVARNAERHADNPVFRADMIATLTESSHRMQALLARLSPQATRREAARPVAAAALLNAAARRHGGAVAWSAPGDPWLLADPAGLATVIDHLVQNALDAGGASGGVTLTAAADGDVATIVVADSGCGMSTAFVRDQLFRPFVSTKAGGFGLGAFEARQMIEGMGGCVAVASREGEGTRVTLHLPAAPALEHAA